MNWGLIFSDTLARLMGFIGLIAAAVFGFGAYISLSGDQAFLIHNGAMAAFLLLMSLVFLSPGMHDRFMYRTRNFLLRIPFILLSAAWVVGMGLGLMVLAQTADAWFALGTITQNWTFVALTAAAAAAIVVFPIGLGYRAERPFPFEADPMEAPLGYELEPDLDYQVAAQRAALMREAQLKPQRESDMLDAIVIFPFVGLALLSAYALVIGETVQTASHDAFADQYRIALIAVVAVISFLPSLLNTGLRGRPVTDGPAPGLFRRALVFFFGMPVLATLLFLGVAYDLVPWAWNQFTTNPDGTLTYEVTEIFGRVDLIQCVRLAPVDAPDQDMMHCALDKEVIETLAPGSLIEAIGPLSPFGHSFTSVRAL